MATLLDGVNAVMKRVNLIAGADAELSNLTDGARQTDIDVIVQHWVEAVDDLFQVSNVSLPRSGAKSTITLVAGTREYALPSDLLQIRWPLHDEANGEYIMHYPGGFDRLRVDQVQPETFVGLPFHGVIEPINGRLYLDYAPTSAEAGRVYQLYYDRDTEVSAASDTFSFDDGVFRAMVPVVAQLYSRQKRGDFDAAAYNRGLGRAARLLTRQQPRSHYA